MNLKDRIEAIEAGYEFMLAYAAQGLEAHQSGAHEQEIRAKLTAMHSALEGLGALIEDTLDEDQFNGFTHAITQDATHAAGAIALVLSRTGISSQLIDNLNASSHVRAILTDLFLVDEALSHP